MKIHPPHNEIEGQFSNFPILQQTARGRPCIAVPRYGLGDILYTCLSLRFLKKSGIISEGIIFAPQRAALLIELFGLKCIPHYSKILHLNRKLGSGLSNEWKFWTQLQQWRGHHGFSVINDLFDHVLYKTARIEKFPEWAMGNYCRIYPAGLRSKINRWTSFRKTVLNNPRHILARCLSCINQITSCSLDEMWGLDVFSVKFADKNNSDKIVVLPDSGGIDKQLSTSQVKRIMSAIGKDRQYQVFTSRENFLEETRSVTVQGYPQLNLLCEKLSSCDLVVSADSFGAHLAGLFRKPIFIVYQNSLKNNKIWEWWGLPHSKAYHLFDGRVFKLDREFSGVECSDDEAEPLEFNLARATAIATAAS